MQLMHRPPSHIVLPAIHVKREEVGELFERELGTEHGNSDPTYLTHTARKHLREKFLHADAAMTGVNFAVASSGAFTVCTNEGNADMGTSFPKLHIAIMGLEKVIPDYDALALYTRLLARPVHPPARPLRHRTAFHHLHHPLQASGRGPGDPCTYTTHYKRPVEGQEIHVIIVDNGRSRILANPAHLNMLRCLRCGSCMNTCPVYRRSGGYSYSYFIPGPLGINLGMLASPKLYSGNVSACSLCMSCSNVYLWRQQLDSLGLANPVKKGIVKVLNTALRNPGIFHFCVRAGRLGEKIAPRGLLYCGANAWGHDRELPEFTSRTFEQIWKEELSSTAAASPETAPEDSSTNI